MVTRSACIHTPWGASSAPCVRGAILGPQRFQTTLGDEMRDYGVEGRIAAITAGWQEREAEDVELDEVVGQQTLNLRLHSRTDQVFNDDPELSRAHRAKQNRLRTLQRIYSGRLRHAIDALEEMQGLRAPTELIAPELASALAFVRSLDDHHLERVTDIQREFEHELRLFDRPSLAQHRAELTEILEQCDTVAISGGHVATLLNRVRLFGIDQLLTDHAVFAWSAGAIAASDRVVLFHDTPPQGFGNAEVLCAGLQLFQGIVVFPHARKRLRLDDSKRLSLLAQRFAPAVCIGLDDGSGLRFRDDTITALPDTRLFTEDGQESALPHEMD